MSKTKRKAKKAVRKVKGENNVVDDAKEAMGDSFDGLGAEANKVKKKN